MVLAVGATAPSFLVSTAASCAALIILLVAVMASLTLAIVQMQPERLEDHVQRLTVKVQSYAQSLSRKAQQSDAFDLENGLDAQPKSGRKKKKHRRSKKNKLLQYAINADSQEDSEEDCSKESWGGPFNLDSRCWLAPSDQAAQLSEHFIGDEVLEVDAECFQRQRKDSVDAFNLDDDIWLAPMLQV